MREEFLFKFFYLIDQLNNFWILNAHILKTKENFMLTNIMMLYNKQNQVQIFTNSLSLGPDRLDFSFGDDGKTIYDCMLSFLL